MQLDMTKGKPMPVILRFTFPLMIGNMFQQLYNMADTIIVGRYVGADALAAVGSTGTIMFLITGFSQGITSGFSIRVSQRYGARDTEAVRHSVANGIFLSVLSSLILTILCLLSMKPLLTIMNTPENIFDAAYTYIIAISIGIAANVFYNLFSAYLRAVGNSQIPLFFLIFSACLNVILDLLFIIGLQMGVAGAAWATNLAQAISAILCGLYIWLRVPDLKPAPRHWRPSRLTSRQQLAAGIPMAFQFAITASGTMIMQSAINLFGSEAVAAFTASGKLMVLLTQGMVAMGQTMATYGGQNYGCGDIKRIKAGVRAALIADSIYSVSMAVFSAPSMPRPVFFRRGRCECTAAMGKNLQLSLHCFLCPVVHDLHLPKYHAGMRLQLPADDGRCCRASCTPCRFDRRHEAFKLSNGLRCRSGCMGRCGGIYRYVLSVRDKEN